MTKKGFTLIELLVSLSIFIVFLGVISQSYVAIVRAQRQANGVRKTYSEVRSVMETFAQDIRLNTPDYDCYEQSQDLHLCPADITNYLLLESQHYLVLTNQDKTAKIVYRFDPSTSTVQVKHYQKTNDVWEAQIPQGDADQTQDGFQPLLSKEIKVKNLNFALYPLKNPYSQTHYAESQYQFQPHVKIFMTVETTRENLPPYVINLQTSFSSRVYSRK